MGETSTLILPDQQDNFWLRLLDTVGGTIFNWLLEKIAEIGAWVLGVDDQYYEMRDKAEQAGEAYNPLLLLGMAYGTNKIEKFADDPLGQMKEAGKSIVGLATSDAFMQSLGSMIGIEPSDKAPENKPSENTLTQ